MKIQTFLPLLQKAPSLPAVFYLYGSNQGLLSFREQTLLKILKETHRSLKVDVLESFEDLNFLESPSLFGEPNDIKLYRFDQLTEKSLGTLQETVKTLNTSLLLISQSLNFKSKVTQFLETQPHCYALGCYLPAQDEITQYARLFLTKHSITLDPSVFTVLIDLLKTNLEQFHQNLEKLSLYAHNTSTLTLEDIESLLISDLKPNFELLCQGVLTRQSKSIIERMPHNLDVQDSIALHRLMLRYFLNLFELRHSLNDHTPLDKALTTLSQPVYSNQAKILKSVLPLWSVGGLKSVLGQLEILDRSLKSGLTDMREHFLEILLRIAYLKDS
ncbi:DNA polymerase III subunit delta [Candidatus Nucleicultrix amoebiphila]|uniref:Uncharacterized protein n=1 Tax=Candidatus Nucleicultrix amoebiphila FS5 TaxID=1414854 RepID=A0A1W6N532_9PROT|nr:hypothetical protein [Candidatus Nucleicultrix amoebiphila]ARN84876.1 hypothetical protein GQ61_05765 [Candidatus Nucleicultrix amoebiphila FS5]